jgi:hypothetical protein
MKLLKQRFNPPLQAFFMLSINDYIYYSAGKRNSNNTYYQFWQQDNHPIALEYGEVAKQKLNYIHDNPVRAGIVFSPEYYVYSSALNYYLNRDGLVPLELLI